VVFTHLVSVSEIDGILAFVVATAGIWGNEKDAGGFSLHVVNMVHRIVMVFSVSGRIDGRRIRIAWVSCCHE